MDDTWETLVRAAEGAALAGEGGVRPHEPKAAVLCCSDARVPPSLLFDQPPGSLFVIRFAGNTASPPAVASLDYAVEHLGVPLIVVLGHTSCGAVDAAMQGVCCGSATAITGPICDIVDRYPDADADAISIRNVQAVMAALAANPGPTGEALRAGRLQIRGAVHDLSAGHLVAVDPNSDPRTMERT